MPEFRFNPDHPTPTVAAIFVGPKRSQKVRLVFDTGCAITEIDTQVMRFLGYTSEMKLSDVTVSGISGPVSKGELHEAKKFFVLGSQFKSEQVVSTDMKSIKEKGYHGLLGWNMIRHFYLEMHGPNGTLKAEKITQD